MTIEDPIEVDLEEERLKSKFETISELITETGKEVKLRLVKDLAEDLSKDYNVELKITQRKKNELLIKKITINLTPTMDLMKWFNYLT